MARGSTNAFLTGATGGLGRLAQTLAGARQARQDAFDQQMAVQTKMAQALAAIDRDAAAADELDTRAAGERTKTDVLRRRPDVFTELAANAAGVDQPTLGAFREFQRTGQRPAVPMGPPDESGGMGVGSFQAGDQTRSKITQAIERFAPLLTNTGDLKPDDMAQSAKIYRDMALGDSVLSGERTAGQVGASQAAIGGKPLFNADATGAVLDLFGGKLDTSNPMALATINFKKEQAGAQRANAVQSYAAAENSRASASRTRAEMEQGIRSGDLVVQPTADGNIAIVNKRTAEGRFAMGPNGLPLIGASSQKDLTDAQAKANLFGSRMAEADKIITGLHGKYNPAAVNAKIAAGDLPVIGGLAGMATNLALNENDQLVEQAQRDFLNAVLRRESGAVIGPSEFESAKKQYFPQPGEPPALVEQKARNRRLAIEGLMAEVPQRFRNAQPQPGGPSQPRVSAPAVPMAPAPAGGGWKIERVQ